MKELNLQQLENFEGGRFWGWSCGPSYTIGGNCFRNCNYYIFGHLTNWGNNGPRGCDNLPGRYGADK